MVEDLTLVALADLQVHCEVANIYMELPPSTIGGALHAALHSFA